MRALCPAAAEVFAAAGGFLVLLLQRSRGATPTRPLVWELPEAPPCIGIWRVEWKACEDGAVQCTTARNEILHYEKE